MTADRRPPDLSALARGGSLNFVGSAVGALLSMAVVVVVTNGLGAADGGALFEVVALFNIAIAVATMGADTGLLRFTSISLSREQRSIPTRTLLVALVPVAVVGSLLALGGVAFADPMGRVLGGDDHAAAVADLIAVMAVFVPVGALALVLLGATRGHGTMVPTVVAERVGRPAAQLVLGALAIALGASAGVVGLAWSIGVVLSFEVAAVWLGRMWHGQRGSVRRRPVPTAYLVREFWSFTLPRALSTMFRVGVLWLDVLLVGAMVSPTAAATYTVATRLLQAGFLAVDAVGQAVEPLFSSVLAEGATDRARSLFEVSTAWLVGLTWPVFLAVWVFAPTVLGVFGDEFRSATSVVAILAASAVLGSGLGPVDVLLIMAGKSMWSFRNSAISFGLNVVLNVTLIPVLGLDGAALAWAVSRLASNVLPLLQVHSLHGLHPFGRGWMAAAGASLATFGALGLAARVVLDDGLLSLAVYLVVASTTYGMLVWRWRSRLDLSAFRASVGRRRMTRKVA